MMADPKYSMDPETAPGRPPVVLVLMATYNGAPWLEEQVDSVLAQRGVNVILAIGDDCSRDDTRARLDQRASDDPRVRVLGWPQGSGSAGANFRKIFREVPQDWAFDFVALADQDDIWDAGKLASAIRALDSSRAAGYSCAVQAFTGEGKVWTLAQCPHVRGADFLFEGAGQGCTFVVRRERFDRVSRFCVEHAPMVEALHYHEWLIYLLARAWGLSWHFDPKAWMRYRQHGGNEIGARGGWASVVRRLSLIRQGWYGRQVKAAMVVHEQAGGRDPLVHHLQRQMRQPGWWSRVRLATLLAVHGRRRLSDRCVLVVSALAGWLSLAE